jgi:hypothetical protein
MTILETEDWTLLVHDPQVQTIVGVRPCYKEVVIDYVEGVCRVIWTLVEQLRVLIHFPEDDLAIETNTHHSVPRVGLQIIDVGLMAVVRIHAHHLSNIPNFQASIISNSIELIILLIKLNASNRISMSRECLYLFLIMNIPDPHDSILAATNKVLAIGRNREAADLV